MQPKAPTDRTKVAHLSDRSKPEKTYQIGEGPPGMKWIICHLCQRKSFNQNDVEKLYCGYCHCFHNR